MAYKTLPCVVFKTQSLADEESLHSVVISLLRGLAAVEVAAAHLRADLYPSLRTVTDPSLWFNGFAFIAGFAHQAVLVFFVISGWLVGGSLLDKRKESSAIKSYAIDRLTRLWTVLIPTFLLTLLFALTTDVSLSESTGFISPSNFSQLTFIANLFGLQTILAPPFGANFPLWSLANETWYYVMFPLIISLFFAGSTLHRAISAVALLCLALILPKALLGYFTIWLLGVAFSRIKIDCCAIVRLGWLILTGAIWSYYRMTADLSKFDFGTLLPDVLCSLMFLLLLSSIRFAVPRTAFFRCIRRISIFFANFSFSLYVLHIPLMRLLQYWLYEKFGLRQLSPHNPLDFVLYLGMLGTLLGGSYLSYRLFEAQTFAIRRFVKRVLQLRAPVGLASTEKT